MKQLLTLLLLGVTVWLSAQEKGLSPLHAASSSDQSDTYAVVVGISDYQDEGIPDLRFADKDALAFAGFLQSGAGGSLDEDHLKVLINEQATAAQFAIALDWLWEVVKENDRVFLYFSGHGDVERKSLTQPGYLLCWDAPARVYLAGGAIALPMFQDVISTLSVQNKAKVIVITDACRSGKLSGSAVGGAQLTSANLAKQYANEIKILSCQPDEYSIEGEQWGGGRGAFSYHLLDGLYGMADGNNDASVNLKEISRYLEDRVSEEVAPQKQNPMTIGGVTENLTDVFPEILVALKEGKRGQMQLFTATESRGIEDDVLAAADTHIVALYFAFQKALKDKKFLDPATASAEFYYERLSHEPQLEKLHSSMRRNYAAALQDDAQQLMNKWLKTDPSVLALSQKTQMGKYLSFPLYLERAADLLGKEHYMYPVLQARQHFFQGYLLALSSLNPDKDLGSRALTEFRYALQWQAELPQAYWQMSQVYGFNLLQPDSAELYARKAMGLDPGWVLPYTNTAYLFFKKFKDFDRAKMYLEEANRMDSNSVIVVNSWGGYYRAKREFTKAESFFKKAIQIDSAYTMAYIGLGLVYLDTHNYKEAEQQFLKCLLIDSTYAWTHNNLGNVYLHTNRYMESEAKYKTAIKIDSLEGRFYSNLGFLYQRTLRYAEAEAAIRKAVQLDSTNADAYYNLACLYSLQNRISEAFVYLEKDIQSGDDDYAFMINDPDLAPLRAQRERWEALMKKYFPDQGKK